MAWAFAAEILECRRSGHEKNSGVMARFPV